MVSYHQMIWEITLIFFFFLWPHSNSRPLAEDSTMRMDNECLVYFVFVRRSASVCVCWDWRSSCRLMVPPVHGFMNILLWTESPCSSAHAEGGRELVNDFTQHEVLHDVLYRAVSSSSLHLIIIICLNMYSNCATFLFPFISTRSLSHIIAP